MDVKAFSAIAPLFVPADRPERFPKAAASGADAIILDLEDAVAPDAKVLARRALSTSFTDLPVWVRVNGVHTPWHADDVAAARRIGCAAILLPKSECAETVRAVGSDVPVVALIETARGIAAAREIAAVSATARLAFGSIDYAADLGSAHTREALSHARSELVLASRLAGLLAPLDGVTANITDAGQMADDARHARDLGFGGKLVIHPRQVTAVIDGFASDADEVGWARRVLAGGDGVGVVDGAMVDAPVRARARMILARVPASVQT